jgi:hypothetical protein
MSSLYFDVTQVMKRPSWSGLPGTLTIGREEDIRSAWQWSECRVPRSIVCLYKLNCCTVMNLILPRIGGFNFQCLESSFPIPDYQTSYWRHEWTDTLSLIDLYRKIKSPFIHMIPLDKEFYLFSTSPGTGYPLNYGALYNTYGPNILGPLKVITGPSKSWLLFSNCFIIPELQLRKYWFLSLPPPFRK